MTFYLRNEMGETLVDVELNIKKGEKFQEGYVELHSEVAVKPFFVLGQKVFQEGGDIAEFLNCFEDVQELRGWMWETYFAAKKNTGAAFTEVQHIVEGLLKSLAEKYTLQFVQD